MLNGLQCRLAHLCEQGQNIFPVESICENRSERIGETVQRGDKERGGANKEREGTRISKR